MPKVSVTPEPPAPPRGRILVLAGVVLLSLVAGSTPRLVGDGAEYLSQAMNFAMRDGPSLGRRQIPVIEARLAAQHPALAGWSIERATVASSDSRRDFLHFWFYALLVTPALWLTDAVGMDPLAAFTIVNAFFLGAALWVALPRIGPAASLLVFGGPIIWWIDKAHTEVFCFALLTIAMCLMRDKPWWSALAAGMAATQYPPFAVVFGSIVVGTVVGRRAWLTDRRFVAGVVAGLALLLLHPVYVYARYRVPSLLLHGVTPGVPAAAEISAVIVDPTIGLAGNFPMLLVVTGVGLLALARANWRRVGSAEMIVAMVSGAVLLVSCARTTNFHHGATPSMSRYGLWLIPLVLPLLGLTWRYAGRLWRGFLWTTASVSAVVCLFAFHPGIPEGGGEPTWAATWLWTRHPTWQNPLFEVFSEVTLHREDRMAPASTTNCEKVLVAGPGNGVDVAWPLPCYPAVTPDWCRSAGEMCYANRTPDGYAFAPVPGRGHGMALVPNPASWSPEMAPHVRTLFDAWGWRGRVPNRRDLDVLRQSLDVSILPMGTNERFAIILRDPGERPMLTFRFPAAMSGQIVDPRTGTVLQHLVVNQSPNTLWQLELPAGYDVLILVMTSESHG